MKADFSKIINDSIKITRSNKKLWVMGLVLATLTAGSSGGSGGGSSSTSNNNDRKEPNGVMEKSVPQKKDGSTLLNSNLLSANLPQVLGTATSSLTGLVKTIPASFYVSLALLIILGIALGTAISLYGQSWSQSGLIHGIGKQHIGESLGLYQMSDHGKKNAVEVIKIRLIPGLILTAVTLGTGLILLILGLTLGTGGKVVAILLGIIWILAVIIATIIVSVSTSLGVPAINLEALKWKDGFNRGWQVFKTYFIDVVLMGCINCVFGCVVGIGSLIVIGLLVVIGIASVAGAAAFPPFLVAAGPIVFLLILAFIMFSGAVNAIYTVFKQSTWVLLYKQLTEEPTSGQ